MKPRLVLIAFIFCVATNTETYARYYDPACGRFISPDTVVSNSQDPQTLNRYAYVRNNPLNLVDPSGNLFWVPIIVGAAMGAYSAGRATNFNSDAMLRGALVGAVGGAVGAGIGSMAMTMTNSALISGIVGGAAGGAASGCTGAAMFGGHRGIAMEQGALWGGINGGIAQGFTMVGVPDAFAQAGSGYVSGHWEGGDRAANRSAGYGFAGSIMAATLTMNGIDSNGKVPMQNSTEELSQWSTNQSMVVTPEVKAADWFWVTLGLISGGYEHTRHTKDFQNHGGPDFPRRNNRFYRRIADNVPHPGEGYLSNYNLFRNNCTTRFGYISPSAYRANSQYLGPSVPWYHDQ